MNTTGIWILAALGAYFAGAIPFGFLIGKMRGVDVRTVGSKNIGATNVFRTVGRSWGLLAFACDFLKGLLPTLAAQRIAGTDAAYALLPLVTGILCVAGHMFTCFMRFKGGKGIATGFGMLVALQPHLVLIAFAVFLITVRLSHFISLGSIMASKVLLIGIWLPIPVINPAGWRDLPMAVVVSLVAIFAIWKHKANILRLAAGTENRFYWHGSRTS